ncbi:MAG: GntR family transcriptional regulator, partial [Alicyclobacillus sp.]|nr:GntR family transcriptional regulator [Alicyclobacillus sp.]
SLRVNPNTVSHAYQQLERDGLTETRRGQGTFITTSVATIEQFRRDMAQRLTHEFIQQMFAYGLGWQDIEHFLRAELSAARWPEDAPPPLANQPAPVQPPAPSTPDGTAPENPSPKPWRGGNEHA